MIQALNIGKSFSRLPVFLLLVLFLWAGFGNISSPLMWNDECHTAMTANFTLKYGYPRITDGKNIVYAYQVNEDGSYEKYDAKLKAGTLGIWAGYYYAAIPVWLVSGLNDPYLKTGFIRTWFMLSGILGLFFFWKSISKVIPFGIRKDVILAIFIIFCLLNISLLLHLKEVRYYSLSFMLAGLATFSYVSLWSLQGKRKWLYAAFLCFSMAIQFFSFYPVYFIFLGIFFLHLFASWALDSLELRTDGKFLSSIISSFHLDNRWISICALAISLMLILPFFPYFQPLAESSDVVPFRKNLLMVLRFFSTYDFLYVAIIFKVFALLCFYLNYYRTGNYSSITKQLLKVNLLFSLGFVVYLILICRMPEHTFLYTRYYLPLFPLLYGTLLLDGLTIQEYTSEWKNRKTILGGLFLVSLILYLPHFGSKLEKWSGKANELTRQYKGPLDYFIPYLQERFGSETEDLVIATNYEEPCFMYYLDAKTTIGFLGNNLEEDTMSQPDIIIYRKHWKKFEPIFENFLKGGDFEKLEFPVQDLPVNNLPQFDFNISHRFKTAVPDGVQEPASIYIRKD